MKRCKCKNPTSRILGNAMICTKCNGIIIKVRKTFYRRTKVKLNQKKYNRAKSKEKLRKELEDVE